jgi:hypothetical protein
MVADPPLTRKALRQALLAVTVVTVGLNAQKFYDDDPVSKEPPPLSVEQIKGRRISDLYDFFHNTFKEPGEHQVKGKLLPAGAVNTLGEVPDSAWYTNHHYFHPMSLEELLRGPGTDNPPDTSKPLTVIAAKTEGITPGFTIEDARGRRYVVKFDPLTNPEMATGPDVIVSKIFYALGYNVPENYIFSFTREQLVVAPSAELQDAVGKRRPMTGRDVTDILLNVPRTAEGRYRAVASLYVRGQPLGELRYYGTRTDDPNDVVPHERRRDLRGLSVFCAWVDHDDSRSVNTADFLVEENGLRFVKHYLVDFGSTLGSGSTVPNSPRSGSEYLFAWGPAMAELFSLGLYVPRWARARFPKIRAVGRFEADVFDADKWVPEYYNAAFANRLPDDAFWAAKQVMAFTDEEIRALVKAGQYSDPRAEDWIAQCLIKRRDKIGRAFFAKVLPLDRFAIQGNRLVFDDLAVKHKLIASRDYTVQWSQFDNATEKKTPLPEETTLTLPKQTQATDDVQYFAADIHASDKQKTVTVYVRKKAGRIEVVGVDRTW